MTTCEQAITSNLLNVKQVAARFGCSRQTIIRWVASGELKSFRIGNVLRFTPDAVKDFISANEEKRNAKA